MSHLLVIGNGFDLDLGLKTKYSDFAASEHWPFENPKTPLAEYLESIKTTERWLDLEMALGEYAADDDKQFKIRRISPIDNRSDYERLTMYLNDYLREEEQKKINKKSAAAKILGYFAKGLCGDYPDEYDIISFNYTDINRFAKALGAQKEIPCLHVHGSLKANDSILGFGDSTISRADSVFMRKSFNVNYHPISVFNYLADADEIAFFGLSFGDIDYSYFDDFFKSIIHYVPGDRQVLFGFKKLTFITYDETSRLSILQNINRRTDHKLSSLFEFHNVQFIRTTSPEDLPKLDTYLNGLKKSISEGKRLSRRMEKIKKTDWEF